MNTSTYPSPGHWIGGRAVPGSGATIDVVNPATGGVVAAVAAGNPGDVDRAVAAATAGLPGWAATGLAERAAVLWRALAVAGRLRGGQTM
ncbi:aldehyde dehydrogenase family protein [Streptomyces lushanensis]|uniref:aldehyde dehydrogenase family protein n=1 Tax=Streptomyces lushanensis TaxID=1434255 RepID=UPI00083422F1|nr:aldehyde dehydrogenase family protein [Streptomyces lushanensis]